MTPVRRRRSTLGTMVCVAAALGALADAQERTPQVASFRAAANAVVLDVTVVDDRNRPLRGLTARDFTILENGNERPIVAFDAVDVSSRRPAGLPASDVVTRGWSPVASSLSSWTMRVVRREMGRARKRAARAVVDRMGPLDRAAIILRRMRSNQDSRWIGPGCGRRSRASGRARTWERTADRRLRSAPNNFTHFDHGVHAYASFSRRSGRSWRARRRVGRSQVHCAHRRGTAIEIRSARRRRRQRRRGSRLRSRRWTLPDRAGRRPAAPADSETIRAASRSFVGSTP